jgi:hypothetical protein
MVQGHPALFHISETSGAMFCRANDATGLGAWNSTHNIHTDFRGVSCSVIIPCGTKLFVILPENLTCFTATTEDGIGPWEKVMECKPGSVASGYIIGKFLSGLLQFSGIVDNQIFSIFSYDGGVTFNAEMVTRARCCTRCMYSRGCVSVSLPEYHCRDCDCLPEAAPVLLCTHVAHSCCIPVINAVEYNRQQQRTGATVP